MVTCWSFLLEQFFWKIFFPWKINHWTCKGSPPVIVERTPTWVILWSRVSHFICCRPVHKYISCGWWRDVALNGTLLRPTDINLTTLGRWRRLLVCTTRLQRVILFLRSLSLANPHQANCVIFCSLPSELVRADDSTRRTWKRNNLCRDMFKDDPMQRHVSSCIMSPSLIMWQDRRVRSICPWSLFPRSSHRAASPWRPRR